MLAFEGRSSEGSAKAGVKIIICAGLAMKRASEGKHTQRGKRYARGSRLCFFFPHKAIINYNVASVQGTYIQSYYTSALLYDTVIRRKGPTHAFQSMTTTIAARTRSDAHTHASCIQHQSPLHRSPSPNGNNNTSALGRRRRSRRFVTAARTPSAVNWRRKRRRRQRVDTRRGLCPTQSVRNRRVDSVSRRT